MDKQITLDWLNKLCESVVREAQKGNTVPINNLSRHIGATHYLNNVVMLKHIPAQQWPELYPALFEDVEALRTQYELAEKTSVQEARIASLEEKIGSIADQLKAFLEAQKPAPKKPGRKPALKEDEAPAAAAEPDDEDQDEEGQTTPADTPTEEAAESDDDKDKAE